MAGAAAKQFEKLGAFYLGRRVDPDSGDVAPEPLLYDAKDLTTHAVCVGMTGSGKTGLCIGLLEEAAIDGIPAIAIDPKGDLGNLLLSFPKLRPEDFRPWIDDGEATRAGRSPDEHARFTAELWRNGLADWGQDGARIARFEESVDAAVYTPGSSAGLPLTVLRSFRAPGPELADDGDALRERVSASVSGLLALLGIDADPIRSREHILLSNVLDRAWREGRDLDLPGLIRAIQEPPIERVGVMDLESFFPASERFALAMQLNNLLASPGFAAWMEGEPLDVGRLLYTAEGRPRLSVLSIAHLSESERMFFVTLLLNEVVAWMRSQPGTRSLRALLYMDEVFGYFPPTANPPSKTPMLTLLKQARAYGLGVVLATQNPVDLDYKGLSNTGTWFLGRLQTERDKARVIEGLEGASATTGSAFDRPRMERLLAGLGSRVFLMNNVHDDEPVLFHTRWVLSYLRGPLTRNQIGTLMAERKQAAAPAARPARVARRAKPKPRAAAARVAEAEPPAERPMLPAGIEERFLAPRSALPADAGLLYRPALLGAATLHYANARAGVDEWSEASLLAPLASPLSGSPWGGSLPLPDDSVLQDAPLPGARWAPLPAPALRKTSYTRWGKMLKSHLYKEHALTLWKSKDPKALSRPGESEGDFRVRLRQRLHEERDLALEKLRKRYAPKLKRLADRIRRAEVKVDREQDQLKQQKMQTAISVGATVLGALFGRKLGSVGNVGRATTAARGAGRAAREREDVERARGDLESLRADLAALEKEFEDALEDVRAGAVAEEPEYSAHPIRPRKSDLAVEGLTLVWTPWRVGSEGVAEPA